MVTYKVLREHYGDKPYAEGDTREADTGDVAHLVERGVLEAVKAEPTVQNKAAPKLRNKAPK